MAKVQTDAPASEDVAGIAAPMSRRLTSPATPVPRTNLFSNSQYHIMITNAGSGYSTCRGLDVTRWREDPTREVWGQFCYIRDVQRDLVWSAGYQPICRAPDEYEVIFAADKATIRRRDGDIETLLEVTVSPEQPVEVRRITLTNHDTRPRELEITSYAEIVLAPHRDDLAHPAFGKLFLETEWISGSGALLCRRRPRSEEEQPVYAMHVAAVDVTAAGSAIVGVAQYETDRSRFLGRGRTAGEPGRPRPRLGPLGHNRAGARPCFLPPPSHPPQAGGVGRDCAGHGRRRLTFRGTGAGRSVSRGQRRDPRVRAGVGAQPGRASAQRSIRRGRPLVSTPGCACDFRRIGLAGRSSGARRQSPGSGGFMALRHFRRSANRRGPV